MGPVGNFGEETIPANASPEHAKKLASGLDLANWEETGMLAANKLTTRIDRYACNVLPKVLYRIVMSRHNYIH